MWLTIRSLTNPAVIWTYHKKQSLWCMIFSNYKERQTSSFTLWQLIDHLLQIQSTVQALHCVVTLIYIIKVLNYKARTISSMPWPDHDRLNLKILVQILDSRVVTCQVFFLCVCVCVSRWFVTGQSSLIGLFLSLTQLLLWANRSFLVTSFSSPMFNTEQLIPLFSTVRVKSSHNTNFLSFFLLFAPPLLWAKQMTFFFELVQAPVAPPLLALTVRKQTPLCSRFSTSFPLWYGWG